MKKNIGFIILMLVVFTAFGQNQTTNENWDGDSPKYISKEHKGHVNMRDNHGDGEKQGVWKLFSSDRILLSEVEFKDGKRHGPYKTYYFINGTIREEGEFFDGKRDGPFKSYYQNGTVNREGEYKSNRKIGDWVFYNRTTGEIKAQGKYVNGKKEGEWIINNSKGEKVASVIYKDGEPVNANIKPKEATAAKEPNKKAGKGKKPAGK